MASIQYTITPLDGLGHHYQVDLFIAKPNPRGQRVRMPNWIPGSYMTRDFSKQVVSFTAEETKFGKVPQPLSWEKIDSDTWAIEACRGPIRISLKVYAFDTSVRTAFLDTERGFFNFSSLCLQVENQTHLPIDCFIQPTPLTKAWQVVTSLPKEKVAKNGFGHYVAANFDALIDHPVSLGQFTKLAWKSHGIPHQMVFQGITAALDTERLLQDLKAICDSHITFFEPESRKSPFPHYIFHVNVVSNGYGGLEHRSSTALLCKRSDLPYQGQSLQPSDLKAYQDFLGLCSHEYFHSWMVKKVQPRAFQPYRLNQRNYTQLLWLFEGFTSYYDDLALLRSERIDRKTYLNRLLTTYQQVMKSPGRKHQSVAQSSFDAWTKYYLMDENTPNAVVSYYAKGSLVALALDILIREFTEQTKSLDDVMRNLWQAHGAYGDDLGRGLAENGFDTIVLKTIGARFAPLWQSFKAAYIDGTQDIDVPQLFASCGIELENNKPDLTERIQQSLGLRVQAQESMIKITHVLEGYAGQEAGLCPGDLIIALNDEKASMANWPYLLTKSYHMPITLLIFRNDLLKRIRLQLPSQSVLMSPRFAVYSLVNTL